MANPQTDDKRPTWDPAEDNAFFPSPYSLSQFTAPKSNLSGADYPNPYKGGEKILMIGADERYLLTDNGTFFSTGNHPVETLLPMYHLDKAGFAFDVATVSGNPVKFEFWAMPSEDQEIKSLFAKYRNRFKQPVPRGTGWRGSVTERQSGQGLRCSQIRWLSGDAGTQASGGTSCLVRGLLVRPSPC